MLLRCNNSRGFFFWFFFFFFNPDLLIMAVCIVFPAFLFVMLLILFHSL